MSEPSKTPPVYISSPKNIDEDRELYNSYDTIDDFADAFQSKIANKDINHGGITGLDSSSTPATAQLPKSYPLSLGSPKVNFVSPTSESRWSIPFPSMQMTTTDTQSTNTSLDDSLLNISSIRGTPTVGSAGFQLDPAISWWPPYSTLALHSGWVAKRGGIVKSWKQRFLVLMTTGQLIYYRRDIISRSNKYLGELDLRFPFQVKNDLLVDDKIDWPEGCASRCRLQIVTKSRTLSLVLPITEVDTWVENLAFVKRHTRELECPVRPMTFGMLSQSVQIERTDAVLRITALSKLGSNRFCFDCGLAPTTWICCELKVFLCMRCSLIHRRLQKHHFPLKAFTLLKSVRLGELSPKELEMFEYSGGNASQKKLYEGLLDPQYRRPAESNEQMFQFCLEKYETRLFYDDGLFSSFNSSLEIIERENNHSPIGDIDGVGYVSSPDSAYSD
eukprot:m.83382 g.83382  ORF g.83382 m.83382 type:complete len:446 (-) comp25629_c0_seq2:45-1382(-)